MKYKIALMMLCASTAFAARFEVAGKKGELIYTHTMNVDLTKSAGLLSVDFLKLAVTEHVLEKFRADEESVVSINQLENDIELVSNTEIKAWGWCFSVNGQVPDVMGDQVHLKANSDVLRWFYGYAHYLNGEWVAQCVPGTP